MEKLIFLILAVSYINFCFYLGVTAIMTGFKAKVGNAPNKDESRDKYPQDNVV